MEKDLTAGLEAAEATEKVKKEKAPLTAEEIQVLKDASEKIVAFGVSDNFAKVMALIPVWGDKEAAAPVKQAVIDSFGGSETFKDYIDGEFSADLEVINGMQKAVSVLNNIRSFYARRVSTRKAKLTQVNIGGKFYDVNADYLTTLAGKSKDEKRELLLAHADTKETQDVEIL